MNIGAEIARLAAALERMAAAQERTATAQEQRATAAAELAQLERRRTGDYTRAVDAMTGALERGAAVMLNPAQIPPRPGGQT